MWRLLVVCALLPACSLAFVKDPPTPAAIQDRNAPLDCTPSRALPMLDIAIGALLGGFVAGTTYHFVEESAKDCPVAGACRGGTGPAVVAGFLVVSPWWISAAVGISDTGRCRDARRARGWTD